MDNVVSLPYGNKPKAVPFPHFPSTLHAVIWRNWDVVDHKRIAATLQMSVRDVVSIGQAMGLPAPQRLTNLQRKRIALTIIRRNWHLLPYNQLLQLLDWTAAELEFTLREDDFLYVKLGNHKPDCSPVVYRQQTQRDWDHCARIKAAVTAAFPDGLPEIRNLSSSSLMSSRTFRLKLLQKSQPHSRHVTVIPTLPSTVTHS